MPPAAPTIGDKRVLAAAGVGIALLAAVAFLSSLGGPHGPIDGLSWVMLRLASAGSAPAAYILGAAGLGRLALPLFRGSRDEWALQLAVGLGLMLSLSHALGVLRLFEGVAGHYTAIGIIIAGIALLAHQLLAGGTLQNASMVLPASALPALAGGALLLVAACSPPGWLWDSEFGGFDALAYHLELPQQWLARGWLWPVDHNVYSYLPGYVESAYMHLGAFLGSPTSPSPGSPMIGLLSGDGSGALACQLLHAGLTLCGGVLVGRAARLAAERCGLSAKAASAGAGLAASLFLLTPWTIVVGSLAYNEAAMTALGAGALAAAIDDRLPAIRRGLIAGLLVGCACGAKPTALFLVGAPVGLALLGLAPARDWPRLILAGAAIGAASLAPWLLRNWYACGNPVFPFAASWFGSAHWTAEQVSRFAAGHAFDGSVLDRVSLLVLPEHPDPANPARATHRGMAHPQWFFFFPIVALAGAAGCRRTMRRIAIVLLVGIAAQIALWLLTTHIQSRFLLPLTITGAVLFGLAGAAWSREKTGVHSTPRRRPLQPPSIPGVIALMAVLAQGIASVVVFAQQGGGRPNACLIGGSAGGLNTLTGDAVRAAREALASAPEAERIAAIERLSAAEYINFALPPTARVYLLGDSAVLYYRPPYIYHSTWDTSPLGLMMRADPDRPAVWTEKLRKEGIPLVLVNFAELDRLHRSRWYDPLVTPEAVQEWLRTEGTLIRSWPQSGHALFSIAPPRPAPAGADR
jgi:hypothetical protein